MKKQSLVIIASLFLVACGANTPPATEAPTEVPPAAEAPATEIAPEESEVEATEPEAEAPQFSGYYSLQTEYLEAENKCLEGNVVADDAFLGGGAFMDDCGPYTGQAWKLVSSEEEAGYYYLQTEFLEADNKCLESNFVEDGAFLDGAAYMADCEHVSGQLWQLIDFGDGYYALQSYYLQDQNKCLEGNRVADDAYLGGAAFMANCGEYTGQAWKLTPLD